MHPLICVEILLHRRIEVADLPDWHEADSAVALEGATISPLDTNAWDVAEMTASSATYERRQS